MSGGVPMVTCRVCQAMIDITWKREQHVVKCTQCNEATVRKLIYKTLFIGKVMLFDILVVYYMI